MSPGQQQLIVNLGLLLAALPLLATALGIVQYTFGQLFGVLTGVGRAFYGLFQIMTTETGIQVLTLSFQGFARACTAIVGSVQNVMMVLRGFFGAITDFWGLFDKFSAGVWRFVDSIARMSMLEGLSAIVNGLTAAFNGLMLALASVGIVAAVVAILTDLRDVLVHFGIITARVESEDTPTMQSFANVLRDLGDAFNEIAGPMAKFIKDWGYMRSLLTIAVPGSILFTLPAFLKDQFGAPGEMPDPFDLKNRGRFSNQTTAPWSEESMIANTLKKYPTDFSIEAEIEKKTNESLITSWKYLNAEFDKANKTKSEMARIQRELNEQFEDQVKFEEIFGYKDFVKFTEMNEQFKKMKELKLTPPPEFAEAFAKAAKGTQDYLMAAHGIPAVNGYINEIANSWKKLTLEGEVAGKKNSEIIKDSLTAMKNLQEFKENMTTARFDLFGGRMSSEIGKVVDKFKDLVVQHNKLDVVPEGINPEAWKEYVATIDQINVDKLAQTVRQTDLFTGYLRIVSMVSPLAAKSIKQFFDAFGGTDKQDKTKTDKLTQSEKAAKAFKETIHGLTQAFTKLSQIMGDSFDGPIKDMAEMVALMNVGVEIAEAFRDGWKKISDGFGDSAADTTSVIQGFIGVAMAVAQAIALMNKATDVAGKGNRIMRGAMTGFSIGNSILPGWGGVIGMMIGAIWGAVRKIPWEEIGKRIGSRLGVSISEQLSRSIQKTAETKFGGDWLSAEIFHLGDIIDEAGGINIDNFQRFAREMRDAFVMLSTGKFTANDVAKVLQSFTAFLEVGTDKFGFIRRELREIVALTYEWGVNSKEVMEFVKSQTDMLIEQIDALAQMPAQYESWIKIGERIEEANKAIADAAGDVDKITEAQKDLEAALKDQAAAAEIAQDELENLGIIIAGNVFAAVVDGRSLSSAILAAKDGLKKFFDAYKALGLSPEDPLLQFLQRQSAIVTAIPNVIAGIDALGNTIVGLTNLNLLNDKSFESIQKAGYNAYVAIQAQVAAVGGSTADALLPMQDYLHRAEKAARELGIPLDANTQMMIDQSKELGIWKELGPSATEQMTTAINALITKISALIDKLFGIPDELPDPFENWVIPEIPSGNPGQPPDDSHPGAPPDEPGRAVGSIVASGKWFENWGAGTSVKLHNQEAVIRPDQALPFAAHVMNAYSDEANTPKSTNPDQPIFLVLPDRKVLGRVFREDLKDELVAMGISTMGRRR
jgi:hypothetical protein